MTPKSRKRLIAVGTLLVAGAGLLVVTLGSLGNNLVYYWSPSEMLAKGDKAYGATVRLGGIVQKGTHHWDKAANDLTFRVADGMAPNATSVQVHARETPPDMFREGIGVVVEGTYGPSGIFESQRLMVKHSNEYRPPKDPTKPDDWKGTLVDATSAKESKP